jgi:hypothetical protein
MKNIEKKIVEVVRKEVLKFSCELKKINILIKEIDEICPIEKPSCTLPLADTIGRTYNTFNRSMFL